MRWQVAAENKQLNHTRGLMLSAREYIEILTLRRLNTTLDTDIEIPWDTFERIRTECNSVKDYLIRKYPLRGFTHEDLEGFFDMEIHKALRRGEYDFERSSKAYFQARLQLLLWNIRRNFERAKKNLPEDMLDNQENKMKKWQYIIDSMSEDEINNPELLEKQTSRLGRIAKGSGATTADIRMLLKQYKLLKEIASGSGDLENFDPSQGLSQKQMQKLAKKFGKRMRI